MKKIALATGLVAVASVLVAVGLFLVADARTADFALLLWAAMATVVLAPALTFVVLKARRAVTHHHATTEKELGRLKNRLDRMTVDLQATPLLMERLAPELPLPSLRGWTLGADQAGFLVDHILRHRPGLVLELGSGASTVVMAEALRKAGGGRILSIDHLAEYAEETRRMLAFRGLEDVARVELRPLEPFEHGSLEPERQPRKGNPEKKGKELRLWYETGFLDSVRPGSVDLLLVDGPPHDTCALARWPAFPVLRDKLSSDSTVILDDVAREDEAEIIRLWLRADPDLEVEIAPLASPVAIFRRSQVRRGAVPGGRPGPSSPDQATGSP